jgi:hypothetical protein
MSDYFQGPDTWPLWVTSEQLERLRAALLAEGFDAVSFREMDSGSSLGVAVKAGERKRAILVPNLNDITNVVYDMKSWLRDP